MNKIIKIIVIILLAAILLLSLPFLYVFIIGTIVGSFEMFPKEDNMARPIYLFISTFILLIDIIAVIGLKKMIKALHSKRS